MASKSRKAYLSARLRRQVALLRSPGVGRKSALFDAIHNQGDDVASASTIVLAAAGGSYVRVTGTTTINAIGEQTAGQIRFVVFTGVLTLTHNATSLILPAGSNVTTYAGYTAQFMSLGGGNWRMLGDNSAYQPLDGTLTALAALTIAANSILVGTGADAFSVLGIGANQFPGRSSSGDLVAKTLTDFALTLLDDASAGAVLTTLGLTANGQSLVTAANYAAMRALLDLEAGTDFYSISAADAAAAAQIVGYAQPLDGELTALAGLVSAADKLPYFTGSGTAGLADFTAFARTIVDDADASTVRTTLGLGTLATQSGTFSGTSSGTNTGDQTITLTGDVTGSGTGSFAATIANDAVTYAKMQNVTDARLLGRSAGSSGDCQEITTGSGLSLAAGVLTATGVGSITSADGSITPTAGDIIVNSNWLAGQALINGYLSCSVAANALTIAIKNSTDGGDPSSSKPVKVVFRNVTLTSGDYTVITLTAATSLTISSGSTLATINSKPFRFWIVGFNDAGTFRLGVINTVDQTTTGAGTGTVLATHVFDLFQPISGSLAEGGAGGADSAHVAYTGTSCTSKPYTVLGYLEYSSGLATAGSYASAPTTVQSYAPGVPLPGEVIQTKIKRVSAQSTGTTTIPADDTVPQSSEGTSFISESISILSSANVLHIDAHLYLTNSVGTTVTIAALFQDSGTDAICTSVMNIAAAQGLFSQTLHYNMLATSAAASTTFTIRAGPNSAATIYFNGNSGGRFFGGTCASWLRITEIMG